MASTCWAAPAKPLDVYFNEDGSSSITLTGEDGSSTGLGLTATAGDGSTWWDSTNSVPLDTGIDASIGELDDAKSALAVHGHDFFHPVVGH